MSRHRDEARFYVTGHDIAPSREIPPPHDSVVDGISQLVDRRQVQEISVDSPPAAARDVLERARRALRTRLAADPPPDRSPDQEERLQSRFEYRLQIASDHRDRLREQRENTPWRQRSARAHLDRRVRSYIADEAKAVGQLDELKAIRQAADALHRARLERHGPGAAQLLAIRGGCHSRDTAHRRADRALSALGRDPFAASELTHVLRPDFRL